MDNNTERERRRRKGQTLAEFAITLPILLLLLFGIIEFGRIFQAWVTLQNAARTAARYASTGQYYEDRFVMDTKSKQSDPTGFIPCVYDDEPEYGGVDQRGTKDTRSYSYTDGSGSVKSYQVQVYKGGLESLFASWNDGRNCEPNNESDQDMRKDMARLLSIMEEARRGASGLLLEENPMDIPTGEDAKKDIGSWPWAQVWERPYPRSDQRGWFHVMICSTRDRLERDSGSTTFYKIDANPVTTRFVNYLGESALRDNADNDLDPPVPSCLLNEVLPAEMVADGGMLQNAGLPWMDAGGPADSVTIVVTFNHPLVTPLGLRNYITMQARRTAIVESFRAARAVGAINNPGADNPGFDTPTFTPSYTPSQTLPPTSTNTPSPIPSATLTTTPRPPFLCERITASELSIRGNTVRIEITNDNDRATFLTRALFRWKSVPDFPLMYVSDLGMNNLPHWHGIDRDPPTDTNADPSDPPFAETDENDRTISANDSATWGALFANGPLELEKYTTIHDYGGTQFYFHNPEGGPDCVITLALPDPTPTPTFDPNFTPSPTRTPDCASADLRVRFVRFEQFGIVRLEVVNQRNQIAPFTDFTINWRQVAPGVLTLARVTVAAPPGSPGSVQIWDSNSPTQDANPPTHGLGEGRWIQDYTFSPNSITPIFIDFDGVSSTLSSIGMSPVDFNGSRFIIGCGNNGGGSGPGGPGDDPFGEIILDEVPTPAPTNTPGPSNTPRPTYTPSLTPTKGPPTSTWTPGPTKAPTNTPVPTTQPPPPTNTPLPNDDDPGKSD